MNDEPLKFLMGFPTTPERLERSFIRRYKPPEGSIIMLCDYCSQPTWIGQNQQAAKAKNASCKLVCTTCIADMIREGKLEPVSCSSLDGKSGDIYMTNGKHFLTDPNMPTT